jgi:uncharacterized membrane protein
MASEADEASPAVRRWRPVATTIICLLGTGLAGWLTWGHYFNQKAINNSCSMLSSGAHGLVNCGIVTTSPESVIIGVPVALYGLLYFIAMSTVCVPRAWRHPSRRLAQLRLFAVIAGMAFVLYLIGVEAHLRYICIFCTGEHILQFALFMLVVTGWDDTGYAQLAGEGNTVEQPDVAGAG